MKILQSGQIWTNHQYSSLQYLARLANCTICLGCSGSSCPIVRLQRGARWRAHCGSLWGLLGVGFTGLFTTVQWKIIWLNHFAISRNNTFLIKSYEQVTSYLKNQLLDLVSHFAFWEITSNIVHVGWRMPPEYLQDLPSAAPPYGLSSPNPMPASMASMSPSYWRDWEPGSTVWNLRL